MDYWIYYIILIVCVIAIFFVLYKLFGLNKIKQWLLWAVTEAEKEFGSGTGQLKLAKVYDMFVERFPKLQAIVPFTVFSRLVDEALELMQAMLENNKIKEIVEGENDGK